jgi:L-alanine-DL-glutamate epimerase-like enolase superfamily enzyme
VRALAATDWGLGYTYADSATAAVVDGVLAKTLGRDAMAIAECRMAMLNSTHNLGRPGIVSMAIAAVDSALWDLKARLLRVPLVTLLGVGATRNSASKDEDWTGRGGGREKSPCGAGGDRT